MVHLRVTDSSGVSSTATHTVTVSNRPPTASFNVDPQTVVTGEPSHFDAGSSTDPDGTIKSYLWDLDGNGSFETDTGTSPVTSRFYGSPGNVIVGLQVTDDGGDTATTQRTVTVNEAPPFADGPGVPPPDTNPLPGVDPTPRPPDPIPNPQPKPGKAPRGSLRVLTRSLKESLRRGIAVRFSSSAAATARFKLVQHSKALGSWKRLVGTGRASIRLKPAHALSATAGPVTVKLTLIGADGLTRTYTTHATLR
jgi:PKD repeat protein